MDRKETGILKVATKLSKCGPRFLKMRNMYSEINGENEIAITKGKKLWLRDDVRKRNSTFKISPNVEMDLKTTFGTEWAQMLFINKY